MSEYKGIKGFQVQTRSSDPIPYAQALEDNPYAGTWASSGGLNTARSGSTGAGIQTAALMAGGYGGSPQARTNGMCGRVIIEVLNPE